MALKEPCKTPDPVPTVYAGRVSNAEISMSSMINWAVGLAPYKDSWFSGRQDWSSSTCLVNGKATSPPYYGMQEKHPELQALVSALSAGPIAPGDAIGSSNRSLIMTTCREDGVLLKPDRPAFPPGAMFLKRLRGAGEVQLTFSTLTIGSISMRWGFLLSFAMGKAVELSMLQLGVDEKVETGVAWSRKNLEPLGVASGESLRRYGPGLPELSLPMQEAASGRGCCSWGLYTYWRTAPTSCGGTGWTLLGELDKLISISAQRIVAVTEACDADGAGPSLVVDVVGQPKETVALTLLPPPTAAQRSHASEVVELVVSANGKAAASCSAGKCAQVYVSM